MATSGVTVKGLKETVRTLEKFGVSSGDLKAAFTRIGKIVVDEARVLAPVKSGRLLSSIKASKTKNKSVVRAGAASIPYAGVIHYGGYNNIEPHPFLTSAVSNTAEESFRAVEQELYGLIRQAGLGN